MAQYAILIYEAERGYAAGGQESFQQAMEAHGGFGGQVGERGGKILGGDALEPTSTATSIRGDIVTDGPFAETKEALGGFYLVEARDLDHAIEIAKLCPAPRRRRTVPGRAWRDRKSTRLNSSHANISYAVFCLKKKIAIRLP